MRAATELRIRAAVIVVLLVGLLVPLAGGLMLRLAGREWVNPAFYPYVVVNREGEPRLPSHIPRDSEAVVFRYSPQVLQRSRELYVGFRSDSAETLVEPFREAAEAYELDSNRRDDLERYVLGLAKSHFGEGEFELYIARAEGFNHPKIAVAALDRGRGIAFFYQQ